MDSEEKIVDGSAGKKVVEREMEERPTLSLSSVIRSRPIPRKDTGFEEFW